MVILVTAIIAFGIGYLVYMNISPQQDEQVMDYSGSEPTGTPRAAMRIEPEETTVSSGSTFVVEVHANANGNIINGTDAVVVYDPQYFEAVEVKKSEETPDSFSLMRNLVEDQKVVGSLIRTQFTDDPSYEIPIVAITFRALTPGTTALTLDHQPGTTKGSTIIQADNSDNILDSTKNATIIIQ